MGHVQLCKLAGLQTAGARKRLQLTRAMLDSELISKASSTSIGRKCIMSALARNTEHADHQQMSQACLVRDGYR